MLIARPKVAEITPFGVLTSPLLIGLVPVTVSGIVPVSGSALKLASGGLVAISAATSAPLKVRS